LERDITGAQGRGFEISKELQLQEIDTIKVYPITKTEWNEYCGKNFRMSKVARVK